MLPYTLRLGLTLGLTQKRARASAQRRASSS